MSKDMVLGSSWSLDSIWFWVEEQVIKIMAMVLVGTWYPDTNKATGCSPTLSFRGNFGGNMSLGLQHRPGCHRTMNPDMAISSNLSLDDTMALGGSTEYPDQHGSGS